MEDVQAYIDSDPDERNSGSNSSTFRSAKTHSYNFRSQSPKLRNHSSTQVPNPTHFTYKQDRRSWCTAQQPIMPKRNKKQEHHCPGERRRGNCRWNHRPHFCKTHMYWCDEHNMGHRQDQLCLSCKMRVQAEEARAMKAQTSEAHQKPTQSNASQSKAKKPRKKRANAKRKRR